MFFLLIDGKGKKQLCEAYQLIKDIHEKRGASEDMDPIGQDLFVLCAETALQVGLYLI